MNKKVLVSGILLGLLAIILGAFAAHGLENLVSPDAIAIFETGVEYQMYNALFLLFLGTAGTVSNRTANICYYLTISGIILFSGSLYLLATDSLMRFDAGNIGFVTPVGGILMISAWVVLLVSVLKLKNQ